jgi:hypothetical protein
MPKAPITEENSCTIDEPTRISAPGTIAGNIEIPPWCTRTTRISRIDSALRIPPSERAPRTQSESVETASNSPRTDSPRVLTTSTGAPSGERTGCLGPIAQPAIRRAAAARVTVERRALVHRMGVVIATRRRSV